MAKQFYDYYQPGKKSSLDEFPSRRQEQKRTIGFEEPVRHKRHAAHKNDEFRPGRFGTPEQLNDAERRKQRPVPEPDTPEQPPKRKKRWLRRVVWTFVTIIFVALLGSGWVSWKFLHETTNVFGGTAFGNAIKLLQPTTLQGESRGHVNVLVAGNSVDDPGHGGADLTDSIMILSIEPKAKKAYMFSIPRDLWVHIPGQGYHKINEAYHWGKQDNFQEAGYPNGGMGLLEKTIEERFQIPIDYYALVNYAALKNVVNALGGIDITIQSSDSRGLYDPNINSADGGPLRLPNGLNHLDGQTALNLARARGDPTLDGRVAYGFPRSDFDRTEHQRQILTAIQNKMSSAGVFLNPFKLGKVLDGIGTNVTTDLKINEARKLVGFIRKIGSANMQSLALTTESKNYLRSYQTPSGQSALIPAAGLDNYNAIQSFIQPLLGSS